MKACLLAAGQGTRLGQNKPKCLAKLGDRSLFDLTLISLDAITLDQLVIVGGYAFELLQSALGASHYKKAQLLYNKAFEQGSILSIYTALPSLAGDGFIILNADHLFSTKILKKINSYISSDNFTKITLVCDQDRPLGADDMKIKTRNGAFEQMSKKTEDYDFGYIGSTLVPRVKSALYADFVSRLVSDGQTSINVEEIINRMVIEKNEEVDLLDVSGSHWIEVDTPEDLQLANNKIHQVLGDS